MFPGPPREVAATDPEGGRSGGQLPNPIPTPPAPQPASFDPRIVEPLCAVFRRKLKSEGLKYTPERARILDTVIGMSGTFDAESLIERLSARGPAPGGVIRISKATIYRTIKLLLESGILQQVLVESEQAHYQLAYGRGPVATLVRTDEGLSAAASEEVELPELDALAQAVCAARGLVLGGHRFVIYAQAPGTRAPEGMP